VAVKVLTNICYKYSAGTERQWDRYLVPQNVFLVEYYFFVVADVLKIIIYFCLVSVLVLCCCCWAGRRVN